MPREIVPKEPPQNTPETDVESEPSVGFSRAMRPTGTGDDPRPLRPEHILHLQRHYGNTYVRRMLARRDGAIQREVGTGQKHTIKTPKSEVPLGITVPKIPIKLKSVAFSAECVVTVTPKESKDADTQARGGFVGGGDVAAAGLQGEVEHKWAEWKDTAVGDISMTSKGSGEVTTDGGKIGLDVAGLKIGRLSFALKFNILSYSADKSKLEFATLTFEEALTAFRHEETAPNGDKLKFEFKPKAEWKFEPNYEEIGKWLVEKFGEQAAVELGLAGGIIAAGVATIVAGVVTASLGAEVSERVERAVKATNDFCSGYQEVLTGDGNYPNSDWAWKGVAAAHQVLAKSKVPPEALQAEARKRNLRSEAFAIGWPQVRTAMLEDYKEEHWFEWKVYGEDGPGYRDLKRLLDSRHLNF